MFLSSGDDALELRNLVDGLVSDAVNSELYQAGSSVRIFVDRWERTAPGRAYGESINDWFVRRARGSSLTLCLLLKQLRGGTKQELETVLETDDVELSVVWFVDRTTWPLNTVGRFLRTHQSELFVSRAGPPEGPGATIALVRVLLHIIMKALTAERDGGFRERR